MKFFLVTFVLLISTFLPAFGSPPLIAELKIAKKISELKMAAASETAWACLHSAAEELTRTNDPAAGPARNILTKFEHQGMPVNANPQDWAEAQLAEILGNQRATAFHSNWKPLNYRLEPLNASQLFKAEKDATSGVPALTPLPGYDPQITRINRRAAHTMEDPFQYIRHRAGGYLLGGLRAGHAPVEFHAGPLGLALRSLRSRGYGRIYRFTAPGTDDTTADGFFLAFNLTDGSTLVFHAGSYGTARLQRAQIFLYLTGIPASRVSRWLHYYPLEILFSRLNPPPAGKLDVACVGFSRGPVEQLLAREAARRSHQAMKNAGYTSRQSLARILKRPLRSIPSAADVLTLDSRQIFQNQNSFSAFVTLRDWLQSNQPHSLPARLSRTGKIPLKADDLNSEFLRVHRLRYKDESGNSARLLLMGAVWGDLGREVGRRLAQTGYKRVLFLGIAGGLRPEDSIGDLHRVSTLIAADNKRKSPERWLDGPLTDILDQAADINVCSPLVETMDWLQKSRRLGATTVEMEAEYLYQGLCEADPPAKLESLLVISDLPGQAGQTLESRYHHKGSVKDGVATALDVLLTGLNAISLEPDSQPLSAAPRKIGMMTGTFDPIHNGHLAVAQLAVRELGLDRLDLIPNPEPGHKDMASPYRVRNEMTAASIRHDPRLQLVASPALRIAYLRGGTDAMIRQWRKDNSGALEYYQLMGGDSFLKLAGKPRIFKAAARRNILVVVPREGAEEEAAIHTAAARLPVGRVVILPRPEVQGLSSTLIRNRLSRGEPVEGLVDSTLREPVQKWKLYRVKSVPFTRRLLDGKKF